MGCKAMSTVPSLGLAGVYRLRATKVISTNHEEGSIRAFVLEDKYGRLTLQLTQFSETQTSGQPCLREFFQTLLLFHFSMFPITVEGNP